MGKGDRIGYSGRPNHSFSFHGRGMERERGYRSDIDQLEALLGSIRSRCPDDGRCVFSGGPEMSTTDPSAVTTPRALSDTSSMISSAGAAAVSASAIGNTNGSITIEDQIRNVDKVLKDSLGLTASSFNPPSLLRTRTITSEVGQAVETQPWANYLKRNRSRFLDIAAPKPQECEHCRKSLEQICRRLDDLNDEVRRYRDFLGYEKARREPALYKTASSDQPTIHNDGICLTIGNLTNQLTQEWLEKLRSIHNAMTVSTPTTSKNPASPK